MEIEKLVNSVIELIKDNRNILNKIWQEDKEVNFFEFDVEQLIHWIKDFRNEKVIWKAKQRVLVQHYGNPYITALLCLEGLRKQAEVIIGIEDFGYGLNKAIVKIINDVGQGAKILLKNNLTCQQIEEMNPDKVVCLGNSNAYMRFRKMKNTMVQNVPLFNLAVYYDCEEYEELVEIIRNYATYHFYEIEIFDETEELEDVIEEIESGQNQYCAVILSKNKEKQEKFKQEIHAKIICVNENPFAKWEYEIPDEVF